MGRAVKGVSPLKTIRAKCLECVEGVREVRECTGTILWSDPCPLHRYRMGKGNRQLTEAEQDQRQAASERAGQKQGLSSRIASGGSS
jgi:hypothetical protein